MEDIRRGPSERPLRADSVEKQRVASAERMALNVMQAPLLSGFSRLLRRKRYLG